MAFDMMLFNSFNMTKWFNFTYWSLPSKLSYLNNQQIYSIYSPIKPIIFGEEAKWVEGDNWLGSGKRGGGESERRREWAIRYMWWKHDTSWLRQVSMILTQNLNYISQIATQLERKILWYWCYRLIFIFVLLSSYS